MNHLNYVARLLLVCGLIGLIPIPSFGAEPAGVQVESLGTLPVPKEGVDQLGLAGPFAGVHQDYFIVAGGANFPQGLPWETDAAGNAPPKIYYDDIYLKDLASSESEWKLASTKLPDVVGYGACVSHPTRGVICIGGEKKVKDDQGAFTTVRFDSVYALSIQGGQIEIDSNYPPLPAGTTMLSAALQGDTIYVVCGDSGEGATTHFWSLDLNAPAEGTWEWKAGPAFPGSPRVFALAAVQNVGEGQELFVMSGRNPKLDSVDLLQDVWSYSPKSQEWKRRADTPQCMMAGAIARSGSHHLLAIGGADGKLFRKLDYEYPATIKQAEEAGNQQLAEETRQEKLKILAETHPGFSRSIYAYHTLTDSWMLFGTIPEPFDARVCTNAVEYNGKILLSPGERRPGIRTAESLSLTVVPRARSMQMTHYIVMAVYLGAILLNGFWFAGRMKSTEDYFRAGGRIPWWAAGLSIFGTQLSAMTFIAIPAKAFATDWTLLVGQFSIFLVAPIVIAWFLPFYRQLDVTTAYEYLERRFHVAARCFGSVLFMLLQFARIGIVLYLPSLVLSVVTGVSVDMCILLMGFLCLIYSVSGGVEAVIWTDVTQVVILTLGALACFAAVPFQIDGGWNEMITIADEANKFRFFDFHWDVASAGFFVVMFGTLTQNLVSYGTDQAVVQRYMTTSDIEGSRRGIWTNAILAIPASFLFFGIGTALYSYYRTHPEMLDPSLGRAEAILPLFLVEHLPAPVAGLVIAAVFAASMSSIDSAMNSVAAAFTTDFYRRFSSKATEKSALRVARVATLSVGLLGIGFAIAMAHSDAKSIWDRFAFFLGLFGGGLAGLFLLGILTRRATAAGALIGLISSGVIQGLLIQADAITSWFYAFTGAASCFLIGYVTSLFVGRPPEDLTGLTLRNRIDHSMTAAEAPQLAEA